MNKMSFIGLSILVATVCSGQTIPDSAFYLGQTPPGDVPVVFAPGIISKSDSVEERPAFSNDGRWLFFNQKNTGYTAGRLMFAKYEDGNWSKAEKASFFTELNAAGNPSFSPDGKRLFFDGSAGSNEIYMPYVMELVDGNWDQPVTISIPISRGYGIYCPSITDDRPVYFSKQMNSEGSIFDIYRSNISGGVYTTPELVIQNAGEECSVDKDKSLIIYNSYVLGRNDYGISDLYIAFRREDGHWTNPKNLGPKINTNGNEYFPVLSPDCKYLFFTRWNAAGADIYWVNTSFIDSLRHTNFIPYLKYPLRNKTIVRDSLFNYQIPDSTFIDDDGNNTLTYSAALNNGNPLPAWLLFDSLTQTFSGTPLASGRIVIKVTVTDTAHVSVSSTFALTITNPAGIAEGDDQLPKDFSLRQNYPNPFNPSTTISFDLPTKSFVTLVIYDITGKEIEKIALEELPAGNYNRIWNASRFASGIYFYRLQACQTSGDRSELFTGTKKFLFLK